VHGHRSAADHSAAQRVIDYDRGVGPASEPRAEATRLGSYEILRKLARGGMAELFLARTHGPEGFEKLVVLKKILPNFAENPKFVRLFLDEAKLAATLDHPHIAHVYDMGKVDGHYFFTMEYIHGQDVRATLRRTANLDRKLPIDHAVQIVHAVASALHYAHERRKPDGTLLDVVHRDVSPSNILISYDGAIKLVDFGVAKAATSSVKTRTGTLKGKIGYMSPEQARGGTVDRRSDVFSLGIVLWETVTTQRLFKGDNDLATIQLIINSKPQPPRELRPECSPELERIILKALASEAEVRYQTAEELQLDLEELAREEKLKQSSVTLRTHMQDLFADEIRLWREAQASGVTLTDHVVSASVVEMTTPVSENEASFLDDDDEDEEEERRPPTQGSINDETTQRQPISLSPSRSMPEVPHASMIPPPLRIVDRPSGPSSAVYPIVDRSTGAIGIAAAATFAREPNAFPIAPREWHDNKVGLEGRDPKRVIIGGLLVVAVLAIIALATGGTAPPVEKAPTIDMQVEPAVKPAAVAPMPPTRAPTAAPPPTIAPPTTTSTLPSPSKSTTTTTITATPTTPHNATSMPTSHTTTSHPATTLHHPTTPPPKTHSKDVNPPPPEYDPNSALPPP
jgi:serine/threonine protein kinase